MGELAKRAITGAVYVLVTLGAAFSGPVTTTLLFLPVCLMAARELQQLSGNGTAGAATGFQLPAVAMVYLAVATASIVPRLGLLFALGIIFLVVVIGVVAELLGEDENPVHGLGTSFLLLFLVAVPFGLIPMLLKGGPELFVGFMLLLWTNDTGAYLVGRSMGRTKLLPRVSPKKTVEGLVGGIALAMAAGFVLARFWPVLSTKQWMACGVVVAVASTLGDLLESAFKRHAGVKDSGKILPGHGGILDRFDGFLLAMPAMVVAVELMR